MWLALLIALAAPAVGQDEGLDDLDGPVSMATDMMVWNVRKDEIIERMAVSPDNAWDVPGPGRPSPPDPDFPKQSTKFILDGRFDTTEAERETREAYNKRFGLDK